MTCIPGKYKEQNLQFFCKCQKNVQALNYSDRYHPSPRALLGKNGLLIPRVIDGQGGDGFE